MTKTGKKADLLRKTVLILLCASLAMVLNACGKNEQEVSMFDEDIMVYAIDRVPIEVPELETKDIHKKSRGKEDYLRRWKNADGGSFVITNDFDLGYGSDSTGIYECGNGTGNYGILIAQCSYSKDEDRIEYYVIDSTGGPAQRAGESGSIETIATLPPAGETGKSYYGTWSVIKNEGEAKSQPLALWEKY